MIHYRIGIDPDLEKSGYAVLKTVPFKKPEIIQLSNEPFFNLLELLKGLDRIYLDMGNIEFIVCLEAGWLNKISNYHVASSKSIAARIGKNVGENHAVGKLILEFCKKNKIPHKLIKPTSKKWDGELFKKITGYSKRTNQEQRDAVRTAWL